MVKRRLGGNTLYIHAGNRLFNIYCPISSLELINYLDSFFVNPSQDTFVDKLLYKEPLLSLHPYNPPFLITSVTPAAWAASAGLLTLLPVEDGAGGARERRGYRDQAGVRR